MRNLIFFLKHIDKRINNTYNVVVVINMEIRNPLYQNQGIHVIASIFTIEKGITKVLLIKRKNEPYKDLWALVGGALYNNENIEEGLEREIKEKTGLEGINFTLCNVFGNKNRSPIMRMVAISYLGVIDSTKVSLKKETLKTANAEWFPIDKIPDLAYDHNQILENALQNLKQLILNTDILKNLFPIEFVLPELQNVYESILNKKFDRRNFRRKLINDNIIIDIKMGVNNYENKL